MRKIPFILMALTAMTSCGNTYTAKQVQLSNEIDSLNYALGFVNGAQIKMYYLQNDSSSATITEFMDALTDAYNKKSGEKSEAERIGANIGASARQFEENGLAERAEWAYNGKMFMQGIVNGLYNDTTVNFGGNTGEWFQAKYANAQADSTEQAKTIKAECPSKPKKVTLKTLNDSLNYALGYLNGEQISMRLLTEDQADAQKKAFIKALNASMKYRNPQLAQMGEQIGQAIATQEESGLLGVEGVETVFELISQGFVNGLSGYEGQMTMMEAGEYVSTTLDRLRYGDVKAEGERFLEENKMKEGVITTESGLQYEILTQGTGKKPEATDRVKVHYHGTLIDGTVFDSSVERGEPITFGLNQVIAGWTEGVQLMPVGSKYRFYIPQELGYGSRAAGQIPPYSTLIFEVELLGIE